MIFLIDDDIYYDSNIIRRSVEAYKSHVGKCVVCNYGCRIMYDQNGLLPYSSWTNIDYKMSGKDIFFGSGGGTLFCPADMCKDLLNIDLALNLTPLADDIWLNTMVLKSDLTKIILSNGPLLTVDIDENVTLSSINNGMGKNDEQLLAVQQYYSEVYTDLKKNIES